MTVGFVPLQVFNDSQFCFFYEILVTVSCVRLRDFKDCQVSTTVGFIQLMTFCYEISMMVGFIQLEDFNDVCFIWLQDFNDGQFYSVMRFQ